MSKTLSALTVKNFVINEGPKWEKFKDYKRELKTKDYKKDNHTLAGAIGDRGEKNKQANKSLKERLNTVKSGMFLNEESADITALRNKISQGLILLPGLKGPAADKMEDSIRGWEDRINELKKEIGEKHEK